jgi:hypothetical protein
VFHCTKKWRVVLDGKGQGASECGKRRWRVPGSMVLVDQTKRPPRWTGHNADWICELFSLHMGAGPNV